jgi:hypothetical protein
LKSKYNKSLDLFNDMTQPLPRKRPDCAEILNRKESWALNDGEFKYDEQLHGIIASYADKNESSIHALFKLKSNF